MDQQIKKEIRNRQLMENQINISRGNSIYELSRVD
jgi:hypothetical protein